MKVSQRVIEQEPFYEETDTDNAKLLVKYFKDEIKYCVDSKSWFVWEDNKWIEDPEGNRIKYFWSLIAQVMPKAIFDEAKDKWVAFGWRKYALSARGAQSMMHQLKSINTVHNYRREFDSQPNELNTPLGIVDLKTGKLSVPNKESLHTKETKCGPSKTRKPQKWLKFLEQTFNKEKDTIEYVQRLTGLALIGEVKEQLMPFAQGPGGTGKSTFFNVILQLLGDYASMQMSSIITKSRDNKQEQIAQLHGKRMILMSEIDANAMLDEAMLKQLTGNDALSGKYLYQSSFTFYPTHTLFLIGNTKPRAAEGGSALWRRMRIIPFNNTKAKDYDNKNLQHQLIEEEGPFILQWAIEGAQKYFKDGELNSSDSIINATQMYEDEEDILGQFINEHCLVAENAKVEYKQFRRSYEVWCQANGYRPLSTRTLTEKLKTHPKFKNIETTRTKSARFITGLTINQPSGDTMTRS